MATQDLLDGSADGFELVIVQRPLAIGRGVPGREEQGVPVAQRDLEVLGQVQHELTARPRTSGLDEAEVSGGDFRLARQVELAEASPLAPVTQEVADVRRRRGDGHRVDGIAGGTAQRLPRR
jgi:hypothetical protein